MYRNNNKVFAPFQFKSQDPQELMSEIPGEPADIPVMRKKKWPLVALLLILGVAFLVLFGLLKAFPWSCSGFLPFSSSFCIFYSKNTGSRTSHFLTVKFRPDFLYTFPAKVLVWLLYKRTKRCYDIRDKICNTLGGISFWLENSKLWTAIPLPPTSATHLLK